MKVSDDLFLDKIFNHQYIEISLLSIDNENVSILKINTFLTR